MKEKTRARTKAAPMGVRREQEGRETQPGRATSCRGVNVRIPKRTHEKTAKWNTVSGCWLRSPGPGRLWERTFRRRK